MDFVQQVTQGIEIQARSQYVPEQSDIDRSYYFFAYQIVIRNLGNQNVQLLSRRWTITDSQGRVEEVEGEGVIGEQPVIPPGKTFEYASFCPINTVIGSMVGEYEMLQDDGEKFWAQVPEFQLIKPGAIGLMN